MLNRQLLILSALVAVFAFENQDQAGYTAKQTPQTYSAAVLLLVSGFLLSFFGYKLFRPTLFIVGFIFAFLFSHTTLANMVQEGKIVLTETWLLAGPLIAGLMGGFLAFALFSLGLFFLGAITGGLVALSILTSQPDLVTSEAAKYIVIFGAALVGGVLLRFLEKPVLIISTSSFGSFLLINGVDIFMETGFLHTIRAFLKGKYTNRDIESKPRLLAMLCALPAIAVFGILLQFLGSRKRRKARQIA